MAKTIGEQEGWDKIDEQRAFQEQIGQPQSEELSGDMASKPAKAEAGRTDRLAMPDEALEIDDMTAFGERLPAQDDLAASADTATMGEEDQSFEAAAAEQLEDDTL